MPKSLTDVKLPSTGYAAERWRRAVLPAPAQQEFLPSTITPTNAQTSTPTSGYILFRPAGVAITGTERNGDFSYQGATGVGPIGATGTEPTYVLPNSRYPGTTVGDQNVWAYEFGTDATTIQIRHRHMTASAGYRLVIDGQPNTENAVITPGTGAGNTNLMTIAFGSAKPRRIRFESYYMPFGGVYVPPTASIWGVTPLAGRFITFGDSITDGSNENTGAGVGTWAYRAGRMLGHTDIWEQAKGGTGYTVAGTSATFGNRIAADVIAYRPDRLVLWGGVNDVGVTVATVGAAAAAVYSAITAGLPQCQTFVVGVYDQLGTATSPRVNLDEELRSRAATAGLPFISPITGRCYDAKGTLVTTQGPWLIPAQIAGYVGADTVHPTDAGHAYLARRMVQACAALMPN